MGESNEGLSPPEQANLIRLKAEIAQGKRSESFLSPKQIQTAKAFSQGPLLTQLQKEEFTPVSIKEDAQPAIEEAEGIIRSQLPLRMEKQSGIKQAERVVQEVQATPEEKEAEKRQLKLLELHAELVKTITQDPKAKRVTYNKFPFTKGLKKVTRSGEPDKEYIRVLQLDSDEEMQISLKLGGKQDGLIEIQHTEATPQGQQVVKTIGLSQTGFSLREEYLNQDNSENKIGQYVSYWLRSDRLKEQILALNDSSGMTKAADTVQESVNKYLTSNTSS